MIPYLPQESSDVDMLKFYGSIIENLELRSSHHEAWHTHKRDPSVCWICDCLEIAKLLRSEIERYISKSSLDIDEQSYSSGVSSEEETVNYNVNDESVDELQSEGST